MKKNGLKPKCPDAEVLDQIKRHYRVDQDGVLLTDLDKSGRWKPGKWRVSGCMDTHGNFQSQIMKKRCLNHHIVFFLTWDRWPVLPVDHIDGNPQNNKPDNLQELEHRFNTIKGKLSLLKEDKTSKYTGVCWHKRARKWQAGIIINGKQIHLGLFDVEEEAAKAYSDALTKHLEVANV